MKASWWVKLILGLAVIAMLVFLCYKMIDLFAGYISNAVVGGVLKGDEVYVAETPEPMPTMPDYMKQDSFYDNAGSVDGE